ncbi:carbohydrate-binding protein [Dactylosporangium cerinum]
MIADEAEWPAAPDRDGWHAADEPSELRRWFTPWWPRLIVAGVATALSLLVILLVSALLGGGGGPDRRAAPPAGTPTWSDVSMPGPAPTEAAPAASAPSTAAPATTASPRSSPRSSPPVTFGPVTFEAEAPGNTRGGSAWVDRYPGASGGSIVRNIGDWGSRDGDGFLRFENVVVPVAGTYTLRLFHVNIDNERTRTAVVTVAGRDPQRVTLNGGSTCCTGSTLKVQLRKDGNTITVSNPDGHAPSIDRIVLSLP